MIQTSPNTELCIKSAITKPFNRAMVEWFVDKTTRSPADLKDTCLQLVDAHLERLPPVTIISARIDRLHSDATKMADAIKKANVPVRRRDYEGVTHEFFGTAAVVEKAKQVQMFARERLKQSFANCIGTPPSTC